jgi:hypothetical protein
LWRLNLLFFGGESVSRASGGGEEERILRGCSFGDEMHCLAAVDGGRGILKSWV